MRLNMLRSTIGTLSFCHEHHRVQVSATHTSGLRPSIARPRIAASSRLVAPMVDMSVSGNVSRSASCPCAKNQAARRLSGVQQYSKSLTFFMKSTVSMQHSTLLSCHRSIALIRDTCTGI
eukprot:8836215-Heterocapsa_arctica.AAC.1